MPHSYPPLLFITATSSGDKAKFGLRAREIVAAVNRLGDEGMLDCLNLLHFHVGSQITNIRMVKGEGGSLLLVLAGQGFVKCGWLGVFCMLCGRC